MRSKNARKQNKGLRVIQGEARSRSYLSDFKKKTLFFLLLFLALFLMAQILVGWVYRKVTYDTINTEVAVEGVLPLSHLTSGVLTFEEEIIHASRSGFVYYNIENGKRVPVGTELVTIAEFPLEELGHEEGSDLEMWNGAYHYRDWLSHAEEPYDGGYSNFSPSHRKENIVAPVAGMVILQIDGWEKYGPGFQFPYLENEEEFMESDPGGSAVPDNGERVFIFEPLLKIINNYYWYYSTVLPPSLGKEITESSQVKLHFCFDTNDHVKGERVEVNQRNDEYWEVTWRIREAADDFFNQRWCQAEIVYQELEGTLIPKESLYELHGERGVYTVEQGVVTFQEAVLLGEKEDQYLIKNLEPYKQVITNPSKVKEGQHFF